MGLYNFQARFAPYILDGTKTHTIREQRAHPDKPGNVLHLYCGLRTKQCRFLGRALCSAVEPIDIRGNGQLIIAGRWLGLSEQNALAWRDGFRVERRDLCHAFMLEFWRGRLPFYGQMIHWRDFDPTGEKYADKKRAA